MGYKFFRVMSDTEWRDVEASNRIKPSETRWDPYAPGEVVFLSRSDIPTSNLPSYAKTCCEREGQAHVVHIDVAISESAKLDADRSFSGGPEWARVHRGDITIADGARITHITALNCAQISAFMGVF